MVWASSILHLGGAAGSLVGAMTSDLFGRRAVLQFTTVPSLLGWSLITVAIHPYMIYIGRAIIGMAAGVTTVVLPIYIDEIAMPMEKGVMGCMFQLMVCAGIFGMSIYGTLPSWRWMSSAVHVGPVAAAFVTMLFIPESPRFLLGKGFTERASRSLQLLRGYDYDIGPELKQMQLELDEQNLPKTGRAWYSWFYCTNQSKPWAWRAILVAIGIMLCHQLSGVILVVYGTVDAFETIQFGEDKRLCTLVLIAVMLIVTLVISSLVMVAEYKWLFVASEIGMTVAMLVLAVYFTVKSEDESLVESVLWLPTFGLVLLFVTFSFGAGPLPWLLLPQLLPNEVKGPAMMLANVFYWIVGFLVIHTYNDLRDGIGSYGVCWLYGTFSALGIPFVIMCLPLSRGKTKAEIEDFYADKPASKDSTLNEVKTEKVPSKEVTPEEAKPTETTPKEVKPEEATPKEVKPDEATPKEVKSEEATSKEVKSEEVTPKEVKSEEVTPKEVKSEEATPKEVKPEEATPKEVTAESPIPSVKQVNSEEVESSNPFEL